MLTSIAHRDEDDGRIGVLERVGDGLEEHEPRRLLDRGIESSLQAPHDQWNRGSGAQVVERSAQPTVGQDRRAGPVGQRSQFQNGLVRLEHNTSGVTASASQRSRNRSSSDRRNRTTSDAAPTRSPSPTRVAPTARPRSTRGARDSMAIGLATASNGGSTGSAASRPVATRRRVGRGARRGGSSTHQRPSTCPRGARRGAARAAGTPRACSTAGAPAGLRAAA